jgi:gliding motility-associated lipoprotein GldD
MTGKGAEGVIKREISVFLCLKFVEMKFQRLCNGVFLAVGLWMGACTHYSPKPAGYFRIDLPEPAYRWQEFSAFTCCVSEHCRVEAAPNPGTEGEFFDLVYEQWQARIYCSCLPVRENKLAQFSEESHKFVYLHAMKADAILKQEFENEERRVFGLRYDIRGNVASPTQLALTDSVRSFFRGALYFESAPNRDSIAPVLDYINDDILVLMESFRWKQ